MEQVVKCSFKVWTEIVTYLSAVQLSLQQKKLKMNRAVSFKWRESQTICGRPWEVMRGGDLKDEEASGINCISECFYFYFIFSIKPFCLLFGVKTGMWSGESAEKRLFCGFNELNFNYFYEKTRLKYNPVKWLKRNVL